MMRVQVRKQLLENGEVLFRITEANGELVDRWIPTDPFLGSLDKGGFELRSDAVAFSLGVDTVRAEAGLFDPSVSRSIHRERDAQDEVKQGRPRADQRPRVLAFEAA
jgi:hypothetical protein